MLRCQGGIDAIAGGLYCNCLVINAYASCTRMCWIAWRATRRMQCCAAPRSQVQRFHICAVSFHFCNVEVQHGDRTPTNSINRACDASKNLNRFLFLQNVPDHFIFL